MSKEIAFLKTVLPGGVEDHLATLSGVLHDWTGKDG